MSKIKISKEDLDREPEIVKVFSVVVETDEGDELEIEHSTRL